MFKGILTYITEAKIELKRVNWPSQQQIINYTLVVVAMSIATAIFLGGLDYLFSWVLKEFLI